MCSMIFVWTKQAALGNDQMKAAETSSSSAEDSDTGSESPPPPILPRFASSSHKEFNSVAVHFLNFIYRFDTFLLA